MHNAIRQTVLHVNDLVSEKEFTQIIYLIRVFCSPKSLPLVVNIAAVIKFVAATMSYLPVNILYVSVVSPLILGNVT